MPPDAMIVRASNGARNEALFDRADVLSSAARDRSVPAGTKRTAIVRKGSIGLVPRWFCAWFQRGFVVVLGSVRCGWIVSGTKRIGNGRENLSVDDFVSWFSVSIDTHASATPIDDDAFAIVKRDEKEKERGSRNLLLLQSFFALNNLISVMKGYYLSGWEKSEMIHNIMYDKLLMHDTYAPRTSYKDEKEEEQGAVSIALANPHHSTQCKQPPINYCIGNSSSFSALSLMVLR